ncbi:hypothetical protein VCRA2113O120_40087 [Vibrio crassostreae]|nr:hypothetical protein VCRA2113O120_40087 [Vibrio crassostreae]CAK3511276.1 hypothetical protein VCRA2123E130_40161 [Vibrio crassostreae]
MVKKEIVLDKDLSIPEFTNNV